MKFKIPLIFLSLLILTGCYRSSRVVYEAVENPELLRSPLQGRWIVTKVLSQAEKNSMEKLIGKEAIFSQRFAIFDSQLTKNPKFTMTKVNTENFLKVRYNKEKMEVGITSDKLFLISVYVDERPIYEVLREKEDIAYINIYGSLLQLVRIDEEIDDNYIDNIMESVFVDEKYYSSTP